MAKPEKVKLVAELAEEFRNAQSIVLADYLGLKVAQSFKLRRELRAAGVHFHVAKNTLLLKAATEAGIEGLESLLKGPTAIAFASEDLVAAARILNTFQRTNKELQIKGGVLSGRVIDTAGVRELADLPSREVLLARVAGGMKTPLYGLASVISAPLRGLAYGVSALAEKRAAESA